MFMFRLKNERTNKRKNQRKRKCKNQIVHEGANNKPMKEMRRAELITLFSVLVVLLIHVFVTLYLLQMIHQSYTMEHALLIWVQ